MPQQMLHGKAGLRSLEGVDAIRVVAPLRAHSGQALGMTGPPQDRLRASFCTHAITHTHPSLALSPAS
eukprot:2253935-Rhodomonas_salina.3